MNMTAPIAPAAAVQPPSRPPHGSNGLAVAALVVGIVAFLVGLIPFLGLILGAVAVVLGVLALRRRFGRGPAITGVVLGAIAGLTGLISTLVLVVGLAAGGGSTAASVDGAPADVATPAAAETKAPAQPEPSSPDPAATKPVASKPAAPKPVAAGVDYGGYTKSENRFVKIVEAAAADYADTTNELKGARVLKHRDASSCEAVGSKVKSWVGTIHDVGATGDGDGYVEIEIAPTIVVQTWNNSFSDAFDSTLISSSSSFYDRLSDMEEGDKVVFSGKFVPSDGSCMETTNLTKTFNAADPNFLFRFSNIRAQ
jgi:hypothetical protein